MTMEHKRGVCPFSTEPEEITSHIWRICIPFEDIYTSAFVLLAAGGTAVLDSGDNAGDAQKYIIPFLQSLNREPDWLLCSHLHGDHIGGTACLLERYPSAAAVLFAAESPWPDRPAVHAADGDIILGRFRLLSLPGHTPDAMAVYDPADRILLTQDCFQKRGITRYGYGVTDVPAYLASVERVRTLAPETLIAAHHFVPGGHRAEGETEVNAFLDTCVSVTAELADWMARFPDEAAETVAERYNDAHPECPRLWADRVETLRRYREGR